MILLREQKKQSSRSDYLFHGTSAGNALKIVSSGHVKPSRDGFFYCLDSRKPESMGRALFFATGAGYRYTTCEGPDLIDHYGAMHSDFPEGLSGLFRKAALKIAGYAWAQKHRLAANTPLDHFPAILIFQSHEDAIPAKRAGFINEMRIPSDSLDDIVLVRIHIDDALLETSFVSSLESQGVAVKSLSQYVEEIKRQSHKGVHALNPPHVQTGTAPSKLASSLS